jgi:electron transfer flavoprotein beta subunit
VPVASNVVGFSLEPDRVVVECEMEAGAIGIVEMPLPCVIGTGKGLNKPNYPTLPAIMKARKKEIKIIDLHDLPIETPVSSMEIVELQTAVEAREARELAGPPEAAAAELIRILREEAKVLP